MPFLSFLIPAYDKMPFLRECLASLNDQDSEDWEAIVVDDGSPEDVESAVSAFSCSNTGRNIRLIKQQNAGPGAARTSAAMMANGKYLLPLDSDDILLPNCLQRIITHLSENPEIDFLFADYQVHGDDSKQIRFGPYEPAEFAFRNTFPNSSVQRKDLYIKAGGQQHFPFYGYEEWDYYLRMIKLKPKVAKADFPWLAYRIDENASKESSLTLQGRNHDGWLRAEIIRRNPSYYPDEYIEISKQILSAKTDEKNSSFSDWEIRNLLGADSEPRIQLEHRPIYIWGCGKKGQEDLIRLKRTGLNPCGFVDGLNKMNGEKIQGLPIAGTEILKQSENPFFIVSTLVCYEVEQILEASGLHWKKDWISLH